jgi:hypothetical protein
LPRIGVAEPVNNFRATIGFVRELGNAAPAIMPPTDWHETSVFSSGIRQRLE